jgi:hypothetical protein
MRGALVCLTSARREPVPQMWSYKIGTRQLQSERDSGGKTAWNAGLHWSDTASPIDIPRRIQYSLGAFCVLNKPSIN